MLQQPVITEDNQVKCPVHDKLIEKYSTLFSSNEVTLYCSECHYQHEYYICPKRATFKGYSELQTLIITLPLITKQEISGMKCNTFEDFACSETEHFIFDNNSSGYEPRNLVYIADKQYLAACSSNGRVVIWSIGDKVDYVTHFEVNKKINCAKYINISETKKYLLIGAETETRIYEFGDSKPILVKILDFKAIINDFDYIPNEDKIIIVGNDRFIRTWNVQNWDLSTEIDLEAFDIEAPIYTVICLKDKTLVALEHQKGLIVTDLKGETEHYWVDYKEGKGLGYLPQSERFIMNITPKETYLIDANDFSLHTKFLHVKERSYENDNLVKFILNQNESQAISNSNVDRFVVFGNKSCNHSNWFSGPMRSFQAIEALSDQHRVVGGSQSQGILVITKTNNYEYKHHQPVHWPQGLGKRPPQLHREKPVIVKSKNNKAPIKEKTKGKEKLKKEVMEEEKVAEKEEKMEIKEEKTKKGPKKKSNNKKETKKTVRGESKSQERNNKKKATSEERSRSRSKSKSVGRGKMKEETKPKKKTTTKGTTKKNVKK